MSSLHPVLVFLHRQFIEEMIQTDLAELLALKHATCCCQKLSAHFWKAMLPMVLLYDLLKGYLTPHNTEWHQFQRCPIEILPMLYGPYLPSYKKNLWKEIHFISHTYIYCKFTTTHLCSACTRVWFHHHQLHAWLHVYIVINVHVQWIDVINHNIWIALLYNFT